MDKRPCISVIGWKNPLWLTERKLITTDISSHRVLLVLSHVLIGNMRMFIPVVGERTEIVKY